jgi:hypothetical protein
LLRSHMMTAVAPSRTTPRIEPRTPPTMAVVCLSWERVDGADVGERVAEGMGEDEGEEEGVGEASESRRAGKAPIDVVLKRGAVRLVQQLSGSLGARQQ